MEKILIVDDDQNMLDVCRLQLRRRFKTDIAPGSTQGLAAIDGGERYAVIVSDLRMPGPLDGIQFLSQVNRRSPGTVGIILTGFAETQTAIDAFNQGHIFRFLTKPCAPDSLVLALEAGIQQHRLITSKLRIGELQLRYAQQMELAGRCATDAAQDLRRILGVIQVYADLALAQTRPEYELAKPLREIRRSANTASKLVQQLVALGRRREVTLWHPVFLNDLIKRLAGLLRHLMTKGVSLRAVCAPDVQPVAGDPELLGLALVILVLNARDAMLCGGKIVIRADRLRRPEIRDGRFVCLSVTNSCPGVDARRGHRSLERPCAANERGQGAGPGRWIVADIVNEHHGWIETENVGGGGFTFKVFLPEWQGFRTERRSHTTIHETAGRSGREPAD